MTSRNLFFKLMKEDLKRRIWSFSLFTLVMFLIMSIVCALQVQSYTYLDDGLEENLIRFVGITNVSVVIISIILAIISGLSGFFYLQSRKKVDLYHSIPVRRETLFSISYINGIFIYVVPYIVNILICLVIISVNGLMSKDIMVAAFVALGVNLLFYCLIYTVTILAVMMTGNLIVSILGVSVFTLYVPILLELKELYFGGFFKTYYTSLDIARIEVLASPISAYIGMIDDYWSSAKGSIDIMVIIISMIELVICLALAVFLYKKRPSEAAGKAMAFDKTKPVIKFLLVIPISLYGGIILRSVVSNQSDGWFLFGLIFFLLLSYALIQIIYDFDIKSAFKDKKQMLACFVITLVVTCIFRFDLFRVDYYIPDKNSIKSMSVSISGMDQQLSSINYAGNSSEYISLCDYQIENMALHDFNAAYDLAKLGVKSIDNLDRLSIEYGEYDFGYSKEEYFNYVVKYTLKSGREILRKYCINTKESRELVKAIFENQEFKEAHYFINLINAKDIYRVEIGYGSDILNYTNDGSYNNGNITITNNTNSKDIQELVETYAKELKNLTYEEASENPIASLTFVLKDKRLSDYYVYPSFTKTIVLLEKYGFNTSKAINSKDISEVNISNNHVYYYDASMEDIPVADERKDISYSDPEKIAEIIPALLYEGFYAENRTIAEIENAITVNVKYNVEGDTIPQTFYFFFKKGEMPDFVKNDLQLTE